MMTTKERVIVSACICGIPCRYHGKTHKMGHRLFKAKLFAELTEKYEVIPVCPETLGGLPTPRCPCNVTWDNNCQPLVTNRKTGAILEHGVNLTDAYNKGAEWTLYTAKLFGCKKAFMLKASPACDKENGVAARLLQKNNIEVKNV